MFPNSVDGCVKYTQSYLNLCVYFMTNGTASGLIPAVDGQRLRSLKQWYGTLAGKKINNEKELQKIIILSL